MKRAWQGALAVLFVAGTTGCGVSVKGGGSTYAALLYDDWRQQIVRKYPQVNVSYKPVGSGEGIRQFLAGRLDFAGSDVLLTEEQRARAESGALKTAVLQI